jgi:hypothetical protein
MTTDERIENLEKGLASARRLNRWLLAAVGLALGVWILAGTFGPTMAAAPAAGGKEVRANHFVVEDENGKVRAVLAVFKDGPGLTLADENGNPRAMLIMGKGGPALTLSDENGKVRAGLNATKETAGLTLADENGKNRAALVVGKNGPQVGLSDDKGKTRVFMSVLKERPLLALLDENDKPIWQVPQSAPVAVTPGTK